MAIKIYLKEFELNNSEIKKLTAYISLNIFNKLDIIKFKINKSRLNKLINKNSKNFKLNKLATESIKDMLLSMKFENVKIKAKIGVKNNIVTSFAIVVVSTILAMFLATKTVNPQYEVLPDYNDKICLYLFINCIFKIKLVHIINIIKSLK